MKKKYFYYMQHQPTERFSNRVENYVKYRPSYPEAVLPYLEKLYNLHAGCIVADIGSGTGVSAQLFLEKGYRVIGVEPNTPMRNKSVELLGDFTRFEAINGKAEQTTLKDHSVDVIIAAQAFHWFNNEDTKREFRRILKDRGPVVFIWNERLVASLFEQELDRLIVRHSKDYVHVDHRNINFEQISKFFAPDPCILKEFDNEQVFDYEGLKGRLLSSSYFPSESDEGFTEAIKEVNNLFRQYEQNGLVRIGYTTKVYSGLYG